MPKRNRGEVPTGAVFDEISRYWSEIADALDTEKQVTLAKNNLNSGGVVLDLGCGSGRHSIELSKAGYDIIGLDVSPRLLGIAKSKAAKAEEGLALVRADMRFLPFRANAFSGIVSLDSTFGYLPSENEDLQSLREVARTLAKGAAFLLDVFNGDNMLSRRGKFRLRDLFFGLARFPQFSAVFRWHEYPDFCMLQKRRIAKNKGVLKDEWVFRDKQTRRTIVTRHAIRLYTFAMLQKLLAESKLKVTKVYGGYEKEEFAKNSRNLIVTAVKV